MFGYLELLVCLICYNNVWGELIGEENLLLLLDSGECVILLVLYFWVIDYVVVMLVVCGYKVVNIMKL